MRILKEQKQPSDQPVQCVLFEDDRYTYRIFCTNMAGKAHKVVAEYDKRADVENLVGEAKREGLDAIPSGKFKNNYAFFQIVMLAYNIWRYLKIMAQGSVNSDEKENPSIGLAGIASNTIRIARLKLLLIAAKVVENSNRVKVKYSIQDSRTPYMMKFLSFLDQKKDLYPNHGSKSAFGRNALPWKAERQKISCTKISSCNHVCFPAKPWCPNERIKPKLRKNTNLNPQGQTVQIDKVICPLPSTVNYVQDSGI